jgi:phosphatidylglycerophosphatase GEP4
MKRGFGQFFNGRALVEALKVVKSPHLSIPRLDVCSIRDVPFRKLHERGFQWLIYDKDNTLTLPYVDNVHESVRGAFEESLDVFGRANVIVFSNSAGSADDVNYAEAERLEQSLGVAILRHQERKPGGGDDLKRIVGSSPAVVIGDRYFTDIVFANQNGHYGIHVAPIDPTQDNAVVQMARKGEQFLVNRWRQKSLV